MKINIYLAIGGFLSFCAAILHILIIFKGASWYRFFGAGEKMARMAQNGSAYPTIITSLIAIILLIWAIYAFSAAGLFWKLPLAKLCLTLICGIYFLRGAFIFVLPFYKAQQNNFNFYSSLIVLIYALFHILGTWQVFYKARY